MKTCQYKFGSSGDLCGEEVWKTSDYCILHSNLPEDKYSHEFASLIENKNTRVKEKLKKNDFNFEGVKLFNLDLSKIEIKSDLKFIDVDIRDKISFENAKIEGKIDFLGAVIGGDANFQDAEFIGDVNFEKALFNGDANFTRAVIGGNANFKKALIKGRANFYLVNIDENIKFDKAVIGGDANFTRANIGKDVDFPLVRIGGDVNFPLARVAGDANLLLADIKGDVVFRMKIDGNTDFEKINISGDADFEDAEIGKDANFARSKIAGKSIFYMASIQGDTYFTGAEFDGKVNFEKTFVKGDVDFRDAEFNSDVNFEKAIINEFSKFQGVIFTAYVNFNNTHFKGPAYFDESSFLTKGVFKCLKNFDASFEGAMLKNVAFRDCNLTKVRFKHVIFEHCGLSTSYWENYIIPEHKDYLKNKRQNTNKSLFIISNFLKILLAPNMIKDANVASDTYNRIKISLKEEGDYEKAGKFYTKEMDLKREVYWNENKLMWLFYSVLSITTNYGESIRNLVISYFALISVFALFYMVFYGYPPYNALIYSAFNSVALIYNSADLTGLELLIFVENLGGTVLIALFVYVFAMKMSR